MEIQKSSEDYLETMLMMQKKHGYIRSIDVAEHLGVTKPSVSRALSILKNGGFLTIIDHSVRLTEVGREAAEEIYKRHSFFKKALVSVGIAPETAEKEACLIEHAVSADSFRKIEAAMEKKASDENF